MSGDQSMYLRKKMHERQRSPLDAEPSFIKDGFDKWAENEEPARVGGALKEPGEFKSMKRNGDIMVEAQKLGQHMYGKFYEEQAKTGGCKCGSGLLSRAIIPGAVGATLGLASGIVAGVKGQRKVNAYKKEVAKNYVAEHDISEKKGKGMLGKLAVPAGIAAASGLAGLATGVYAGVKGQKKVDAYKKEVAKNYSKEHDISGKGVLSKYAVPAGIAAASGLAGLATGVYAGVTGQKKVDAYKKEVAKNYAKEHDISGKGVVRVTTRVKRAPSEYAMFVKEFSKHNPGLGRDLMKQASLAWKSQ